MEEKSSKSPPKVRAQLLHFQKYIRNIQRFKQDHEIKLAGTEKKEFGEDKRESTKIDDKQVAFGHKGANVDQLKTEPHANLLHKDVISFPQQLPNQNLLPPHSRPTAENKIECVVPVLKLPEDLSPELNEENLHHVVVNEKNSFSDEEHDESEDEGPEENSLEAESIHSSRTGESISDEDDSMTGAPLNGQESLDEFDSIQSVRNTLCCESDESTDISDLNELVSTDDSGRDSDSEFFDDGYYSRESSFDYLEDEFPFDESVKTQPADTHVVSEESGEF